MQTWKDDCFQWQDWGLWGHADFTYTSWTLYPYKFSERLGFQLLVVNSKEQQLGFRWKYSHPYLQPVCTTLPLRRSQSWFWLEGASRNSVPYSRMSSYAGACPMKLQAGRYRGTATNRCIMRVVLCEQKNYSTGTNTPTLETCTRSRKPFTIMTR